MAGSKRLRLVVLFGGQSAEHDISRVTARHVLAAADPERYDLLPIGIGRDGRWVRAEASIAALARGTEFLTESLAVEGPTVNPFDVLNQTDGPVVVMPLLHGPMGEDGTVQGLLEVAGVAYVGSGVLGSSMSMDKVAAKHLAAAHGFAQTAWQGLHRSDVPDSPAGEEFLDGLAKEMGFPMFVKPANMGSSIGISKVDDRATLRQAIDAALHYDDWFVVEEGVVAREIEVGVLGHTTSPRASVPGEIIAGAEFYDYNDKYTDGVAQLLIPAPLNDDLTEQVRHFACRVFRAYRAEGFARVDFLFEEGGRGLLLNEINTIPGFTPISMFPRMWQASGLPYQALIDELVGLAIERHDLAARTRSH